MEPRYLNYMGQLMLFFGTCVLLCGFLFVAAGDVLNWLVFGGSLGLCIGSWLSTVASVTLAPPLLLYGAILFSLGLTVFFCVGIMLVCGVGVTAVQSVTIGAMVVVFTGVVMSVRHGVREFVPPTFGPSNCSLYGVATFGGGVICFFVTAIRGVVGLTSVGGVEVLGSLLFCGGSLLSLVAGARNFNNCDTVILFRYRDTRIFFGHLMGARSSEAGAIVSLMGLVVASVSFCFDRASVVGFSVASAGFGVAMLGKAIELCALLWCCRKSVLHIGLTFHVCGLVCVCVWSAMAAAGDGSARLVAVVAGSLLVVGGLVVTFWGVSVFTWPFSSYGNLTTCAAIFNLGGGVSLLTFSVLTLQGASVSSSVFVLFCFLCTLAQVIVVVRASLCKEVSLSSDYSGPPAKKSIGKQYSPRVIPRWDSATVEEAEFDVVIVGAGPAGLTLANELGSRGIKTLLLEQRKTIVPDSRFFVINAATMEGLMRTSVGEMLLKEGQPLDLPWGALFTSGLTQDDAMVYCRTWAPSRDEQQRTGAEGSRLSASRSVTSVWAAQHPQRVVQSVQEGCLYRCAVSCPCLQIRYGWRFEEFVIADDGSLEVLVCQVDEPDQLWRIKGRYLVGCDGPTSVVARQLGTTFDGFVHLASMHSTYFKSPRLCELVKEKLGLAHQYQVARPNVGVAMFVLVQARLGLFTFHLFALFDGRSPGQVPPEQMPDLMRQFLGADVPFEIVTEGRWRWNFAVARAMQSEGRVFLAGDACHSWPPFGGLGGNTAYQDASNLGWKLAAAVRGWAGPDLLKSYECERREQILRVAISVMSMTPQPGRLALMGKLISTPLAFLVKARWYHGNSGEHASNHYACSGLQMGLRYDLSYVIVDQDTGLPPEDPHCMYEPKVVAGGRALHVRFADGSSLHDLIATDGFTLMVCCAGLESEVSLLETAFQGLGIPLHVARVVDDITSVSGNRNRAAARLWMQKAMVLCRPDLYVAWIRQDVVTSMEAVRIAGIVSGKAVSEEQTLRADAALEWMSGKFKQAVGPIKHLFPHASMLNNETKDTEVAAETSKQTVAGTDGHEELYNVALFSKSELGLCHYCRREMAVEDSVLVNGWRVHCECVASFKTQGAKCQCCGGALIGSERVLFNGAAIHANCLPSFKKKCSECQECGGAFIDRASQVFLDGVALHRECVGKFNKAEVEEGVLDL